MAKITENAAKLYREKKYEESFREYLRAAGQGDVHAQTFVGWMYARSLGTQKNEEESLRWYSMAAERGYPIAQQLLGFFYFQNGNYLKALEWYQEAASQDYMPALWRLGRMYKAGVGVHADNEKAFAFFYRAAQKGHVFSERELAVLLIKGQRGPLGFFKGISLFARSILNLIRIARKSESDERLQR